MVKLCKDCKFYCKPIFARKEDAWCECPKLGRSLVSGIVYTDKCENVRADVDQCGYLAKWYK